VSDKPIAIRVVRPHETEEAWFEAEVETMTRASIVLVGAAQRPEGTIVRFEVTLTNGKAVLRGEGKVFEYRNKVFQESGGLLVRFTKLDSKSKQTVDAAHTKRASLRQAAGMPPMRNPVPTMTEEEAPLSGVMHEGAAHAPTAVEEVSPPSAVVEVAAQVHATPKAVEATIDPPSVAPPPPSANVRERRSEAPTRQVPVLAHAESVALADRVRAHAQQLGEARTREIVEEGARLRRA
jgi:hypothetical protein